MGRLISALACVFCVSVAPSAESAATSGDLVVSLWRGSGLARNLDLALLPGDGRGSPRLLTRVGVDDHSPSWSPNGDRIVFARKGARRGGIYLRRLPGSTTVRLTHNALDGAPAFSPDGKRIAFSRAFLTRGSPRRDPQILVMSSKGQRPRLVIRTGMAARQLSWSPDGKRLFYSDESILRTVDVATGVVRELPISGYRPTLSADGARIAYLAQGNPGPFYRQLNWGIYVADSNGANPTRVVAGQFGPLSWSPDRNHVLVTNGRTLAIVDVAARTLVPLGPSGTGGAFCP